MSNQFLNKLKNVETSRANLENILASKDIDVGTSKSLPSLVAQVSKLKNPNWTENDEKWQGLVEREAPVDYYKGDDDWKDLINIDQIIEDYDTTSYQGAVFMLFRVSANPDDSWTSSYMSGFTAYRFSDNPTSTITSAAHSWNDDEDIVAENGERFRWVLCFTSSTTSSAYWDARYLVPEAVVYYKGQFRGAVCCNFRSYYNYLSNYSNESSTDVSNTTIGTSGYYNSPKYFEIKEKVTCDLITGDTNTIFPRLKTFICNGVVRSSIYGGRLPNLRYFVYTNQVTPQYNTYFPSYIEATENDRAYIKFSNPIKLRIGNCMGFKYNSYSDLYLSDCKYVSDFTYNSNCDMKFGYMISPGNSCLSYNFNCNIDISDVSSVPDAMFYYNKDTNIKIGIIWGGIGTNAFLCCNKMNTDIICKSNSSTTYQIGGRCFFGTNIKLVDMSESRITSLGYNSNGSPSVSNYRDSYTFALSDVEVIKLSNFITSIPQYEFYNMKHLKEIDLGTSLTSIGSRAFQFCTELETITCPNTLKTLGTEVFSDCSSLKTVNLGNQITSIPSSTFSRCSLLSNIILPNSLTSIGSNCFEYCYSLEEFTLPDEVTSLPNNCFLNCSSLRTVNTTGTINTLGEYTFDGCINLETLFDLSNVTTVGQYSFRNCSKLNITLPKSLTGIVAVTSFGQTGAKITCNTELELSDDLNLRDGDWTFENVLAFLYSLPTREKQSAYTIYIGYLNGQGLLWDYLDNKYVIEQDGKLVFTESSTEEAQTIQQYVNAKKWVLA